MQAPKRCSACGWKRDYTHDGDAPLYGRPLPGNNRNPAVLRSHQHRHHIREQVGGITIPGEELSVPCSAVAAHAEWSGPRGHVSREFIENTVTDIGLRDFFVCGPLPFMDSSRTILIGLGVKPERIMQESFGNSALKSALPVSVAAETDVAVEFARSGKT